MDLFFEETEHIRLILKETNHILEEFLFCFWNNKSVFGRMNPFLEEEWISFWKNRSNDVDKCILF